MRDTYRPFLDAGWKPHEVDALEVWQAAHLLREREDRPADPTGAAVRSFKARAAGKRVEPRPVSVDGPMGELIRASRTKAS